MSKKAIIFKVQQYGQPEPLVSQHNVNIEVFERIMTKMRRTEFQTAKWFVKQIFRGDEVEILEVKDIE